MMRKDSRAGQQATRRSQRCDKRRENEREGIIILSCSVEVGPGENRQGAVRSKAGSAKRTSSTRGR